MKKTKLLSQRRNFLKQSAAGAGAFYLQCKWQLLFQALHNGLAASQAQAAQESTRRYIFITQFGAPSRWTFDQFLTPYSSLGFVANAHLGTKYKSATTYVDVEYATIQRKGIAVPWLWQFEIPRAGGGTRPMDELLQYMINVRGLNTGDPGHPGAQARQFRPLGATTSIGGMVADGSSSPIAGLNVSCPFFDFKSAQNKSSVTLNTTNQMLTDLLRPFLSLAPAQFESNKSKVSGPLAAAIDNMGLSATQHDSFAKTLENDRKSAEALMNSGFPGYLEFWTITLAKYRDLITRAITTQNLAGINDRPIGASGTRNATYAIGPGNIINLPDLRTMITAQTTIANMAEHFTVAEYVLREKLSHFVAISPKEFQGLQGGFFGFDEHGAGKMPILYLNSMYNRAYAACLLELIDRLKAFQIFDDTVIHSTGEFNRSPRPDGTGSDHGWEGASMTLYSGAFQSSGPLIVGDLKKNGRGLGSWGYGSTNMPILNRQLHLGDLAATLAFVLKGKNPVTAAASVLKEENGKYLSVFPEPAKLVDT